MNSQELNKELLKLLTDTMTLYGNKNNMPKEQYDSQMNKLTGKAELLENIINTKTVEPQYKITKIVTRTTYHKPDTQKSIYNTLKGGIGGMIDAIDFTFNPNR
jgi:hypothetical protein